MPASNKHTKPRRKRGGRAVQAARLRDIHSKIDGMPAATHANHAMHTGSISNVIPIMHGGKYMDLSEIPVETPEDHIVPRQSLTRKYLLDLFPEDKEYAPIPSWHVTRQIDKVTGQVTEVRDEIERSRVVWKSDRTLLTRGKPGARIPGFYRQGVVKDGLNKRNYTEYQPEPKAVLYDEATDSHTAYTSPRSASLAAQYFPPSNISEDPTGRRNTFESVWRRIMDRVHASNAHFHELIAVTALYASLRSSK